MNDIDTCIVCGQPKPMRGWCSNCGGVPETYTEDEMPNLVDQPGWQEMCDRALPNTTKPPAHQGHPGFLAVLDEIKRLHLSKGHDYGTNKDTFANVRASEEFKIPAWLGCVLRANDKINRVKAFCEKGSLQHESLRDALIDAANYFTIATCLYDEQLAAAGVES